MNIQINNVDAVVVLTPQTQQYDNTQESYEEHWIQSTVMDYIISTSWRLSREYKDNCTEAPARFKTLFVVANTGGTSMKEAINQVNQYFKTFEQIQNEFAEKDDANYTVKLEWDMEQVTHVTSGEFLALNSPRFLEKKRRPLPKKGDPEHPIKLPN